MLYEEEARVYVRLTHVGSTSLTVEHLVQSDKGQVCYRCTARLVAFDHEKQSKVVVSPAVRTALDRVEQRHQDPMCDNGQCKL